jgi:tetratricopeptide (TPR) repeat protein
MYALALLSKTAVMTLPASLLLLDVIVLHGRWRAALRRAAPLLVLSASAAAITLFKEYAAPVYAVRWPLRPLAAAAAIWFYVGKLLLPVHLLPIYPQWSVSAAGVRWWLALLGLLVAAGLAWRERRRLGDVPTWGLAHFLVTLSPVIGLVPFGYLVTSPVADHFVYLASIGVLLALVSWGARLLAQAGVRPRWLVAAGLAGVLSLLGVQTARQTHYWHDALALFGSALEHDPQNPVLQQNVGRAYVRLGRPQDALPHYQAAARLRPQDGALRCDLGAVLLALGRTVDAIAELHAATQLSPTSGPAYLNLGVALAYDGRLADAEAALRRAVELSPQDPAAQQNLARVQRARGVTEEQ